MINKIKINFKKTLKSVLLLNTILFSVLPYKIFAQNNSNISYGLTQQNINVNGLNRQFLLYVPHSYHGTLTPLLLAYHGGGGQAEGFLKQTNLSNKSEQEGFILVLPEGWRPNMEQPPKFNGNPQTWNDGSGNYPSGKNNIDDIGFTKNIISIIENNFNIDQSRIYAMGFSNGGTMVLTLGIELSDKISAIAVASPANLYDTHQPKRNVPFVYTQGTDDPINRYNGGHITTLGMDEDRPSTDQIVSHLAAINGCSSNKHFLVLPTVTETTYNCGDGTQDEYYLVQGMGHAWVGGNSMAPRFMVGNTSNAFNATDLFWQFLSRYQLKQ